MNRLVKISNLESGYPGNFMLNKINIEINKGSFTGIIGPNGSGKTTLFKTIISELKPKSGTIFFNNTNILTLSPKQRAQKLAIVTQNTEATDITVEDYVLMGRLPYKEKFQIFEKDSDFEIANKYMKLTGVFKYKDSLMSELSGGQQQLAAIAKALTQEPELLLLDEPTSHLDILHQLQVLNLIQKLNEELKLTVLIIIHDLNLAGEYCDSLIMMKEGALHKQGEPNTVLNYKDIETVYNTVVVVQDNPISKKPAIFLVSQKYLNKN